MLSVYLVGAIGCSRAARKFGLVPRGLARHREDGARVLSINGSPREPNYVLWLGTRSFDIPASPSTIVAQRQVAMPGENPKEDWSEAATKVTISFWPEPGKTYLVKGRSGPIGNPRIWIEEAG